MKLTERVSSSPSGEYRDDIITCLLHEGCQLFTKIDIHIGLVRDGCGCTAQVHRHEYLRFVLWWDEATLDHGLYDEYADGGQQYQLCNTDGDDCGYR